MAINLNTDQLDTIRKINDIQLREFFDDDNFKILAEGDSWFAYPKQYILFGDDSNVVDQLRNIDNKLKLKNISSNGDEAVAMIVGSSKLNFLDLVTREQFDLILFSGGGNDIVGRYDFQYFIQPKTNPSSFKDHIILDRFQRRLTQIKYAYIDLIELVNLACQLEMNKPDSRISKIPRIVTHTYDIPIPSPSGATFVGGLFKLDGGRSWMQPYMEAYEIKDSLIQKEIVEFMLKELASTLQEIEQDYSESFTVVNTQGTLTENKWLNEIHPTPDGFEKIAQKIYERGIKPFLP